MNRIALWLVATGAAVLAACGPGEGGTGGAKPSSSAISGRVDGFGSAIVEGERLDDRSARVRVDEDPAAPVAAPLTAIKLGVQIDANASDGALIDGATGAELIGRIESVSQDETTMTVLGQTVVIAGHPVISPVIDGFGGGELAGDRAEVHGMRLSDGRVLATRIERRPQEDAVTRLAGTVSQLDAGTRQFNIGTARVSYAGAAVLPANRALANGQRVVAFTDVVPSADAPAAPLAAKTVRIEEAAFADGASVALAGAVTRLEGGTRFNLRGTAVDAAAANYAAGQSAALLRNDAIVRVRGTMQGGVLRAQLLAVLQRPEDAPISVTAPVTDFSSGDATFRMRGATVSIVSTTQFVNGTGDNLANGVVLSLQGLVMDGVVVATRAELVDPPPVVVGSIGGFDAARGEFKLAPQPRTVRVSATTTYRNGTATELANNRRVRVTGTAGAGVFEAAEVTFLDAGAMPPTLLLAGLVGDPSNQGTGFFLNNRVIDVTSATRFIGGPTGTSADLAALEGVVAIVRAAQQGTRLLATSVEFRPAIDAANSVFGYVGDYTSISSFRVAGQRIDATGAVFAGGTAAQLANGRFVLVEGAVSDGTLRATRVELLND